MVIEEFRKFIKDERWLAIFEKVVNSTESLPLGNYMSAWILNIVLKRMDVMIRDSPSVTHYVRYMDDFLLFSNDKSKLLELVPSIKESLIALGLELKHNYQVYNVVTQGIDMLGYRYFYGNTLMRKSNLNSLYKQVRRLSKLKFLPVKDCRSIATKSGQLTYCNSVAIKKYIDSNIDIKKVKSIISDNDKIESGKHIHSEYILL